MVIWRLQPIHLHFLEHHYLNFEPWWFFHALCQLSVHYKIFGNPWKLPVVSKWCFEFSCLQNLAGRLHQLLNPLVDNALVAFLLKSLAAKATNLTSRLTVRKPKSFNTSYIWEFLLSVELWKQWKHNLFSFLRQLFTWIFRGSVVVK